MIEIKVTEEIHRPVGQVFTFAGEYLNDPHWRKGVTAMAYETSGPPAAGSRTRETMESMGRRATTVAEVTEFSPSRTAFRSLSGPVACYGYREFVATNLGTMFTYSLTLHPRGLLRLLEPLLRSMFVKQIKDDVRRLKALVEAAE
jgi:hypothetical protein